MPAEGELERKCLKLAEARDYLMPKWSSPGNRGVMDRILLRPGRVTFIEFKPPGGRPEKIQQYWADVLRNVFGMEVATITSVEEFNALLDDNNGEKTWEGSWNG